MLEAAKNCVSSPPLIKALPVADEIVDLNFLAAQLAKVLDGQREMREQIGGLGKRLEHVEGEVKALAGTHGETLEAVLEIAETHKKPGMWTAV